MADIRLLINGEYKGILYILFFTEDCASCSATEEILHRIMQEEHFEHENLLIVPKDYFSWVGMVKKYKPRGYPCLIKTVDSEKVEVYSGENIIKIFKTGLIADAV
jgi:thiol-disulfide isomerase/thioredoxin